MTAISNPVICNVRQFIRGDFIFSFDDRGKGIVAGTVTSVKTAYSF